MSRMPLNEVKDRAVGHFADILVAAGVDRNLLIKNDRFVSGGPCPLCGGNDRFSFCDKNDKTRYSNNHGYYFCRGCGPGDGWGLLQKHLGKSFVEAIDFVRGYLGGDSVERVERVLPPPRVPTVSPEERIAKNKAKHKRIWGQSRPVTVGDPVWKYLCNRIPGFNESMLSPVMRYHPRLEYFEEGANGKYVSRGFFAAMIVIITAPDGTCQDLHATYLTEDGYKAPLGDLSVKKRIGSIDVLGGAVRLSKLTGSVLAVTEGIESAYAVEILNGITCWATISTSGMTGFVIPKEVKTLHIFLDHDEKKLKPSADGRKGSDNLRPGHRAGFTLKEKAEQSGVFVVCHVPAKVGTDMLNLLEKRKPKLPEPLKPAPVNQNGNQNFQPTPVLELCQA